MIKKLLKFALGVAIVMLGVVQNVQAQVPWDENLLINPYCNNNDFNGWVKVDGGSGWIGYDHSWVSSYNLCSMEQTINLEDKGFTAAQLDASPFLLLAGSSHCQWSDVNGSGFAKIIVYLFDALNDTLQTITLQDTIYTNKDIPWTNYVQLLNLPVGTRTVKFYFAGKGVRSWTGQYGPLFDNMIVKLSNNSFLTSHTVTVDPLIQNGSCVVDKPFAVFGDTIHVSATAAPGYGLKNITAITTDSIDITVTSDNTFTMPVATDVIVSANFWTTSGLQVQCSTVANGSFNVNKTIANTGDTIKVSAHPNIDYAVKNIVVTADDGSNVVINTDSTFIMPAGYNVTVSGEFWKISGLHVLCDTVVNGSFSVNKTIANMGDTITVTVHPNAGYILKNIVVTTTDGSNVNLFNETSFVMPSAYDVVVSVHFLKIINITDSTSFFEGFENNYVHNTSILGNWFQQSTYGSSSWIANNKESSFNRAPHSGNFNATLKYSNTCWLFTPVMLTANKQYLFSMYARQDYQNTNYASIKVMLGSLPTNDSMKISIVPQTGLTNGDYQLLQGKFTPAESGVYYLGIYGDINSSPYYISIDDISLGEYKSFNIAIDTIQHGTLTVSQSTAYPGDTVKINCIPDDGYILKQFKVSTPNNTIIPVFADSTFIMPNGSNVLVSVEWLLYTSITDSTIFNEDFELGYNNDSTINGIWTQQNAYGDNEWKANSDNTSYNRTPHSGSYNATLKYSNTNWLFTPIKVSANQEYIFNMYARQDYRDTTFASVTVMLGSTANYDSMSTTIVPKTGLTYGDYQLLQGKFTPVESGIYYFGIKGDINSSPYYLSIDDILLGQYKSFHINCDSTALGSISVNKPNAYVGDTIKISVHPTPGYYIYNLKVTSTDNKLIPITADSTFIMPLGQSVTVSGQFAEFSTLSFIPVTLDYSETASFADKSIATYVNNGVYNAIGYKLTLTDSSRVFMNFISDTITNYQFIVSTDSFLQNIVTPYINDVYDLADSTYYVALLSLEQSGNYTLNIETLPPVIFKEINFDYFESALFEDNSVNMLQPDGNVKKSVVYKFSLNKSALIEYIFRSDEITNYLFMVATDSLFHNIITPVSGINYYLTDTTYYAALVGCDQENQSGFYSLELSALASYHTMDYSRELRLNIPEYGTFDSDSSIYLRTQFGSGYGEAFHVHLQKNKNYRVSMISYADSVVELSNYINILTCDSLTGCGNYFGNDLLYNSSMFSNSSTFKSTMNFTVDTTADFRLLFINEFDLNSCSSVDYSILLEELDSTKNQNISFDSLLRSAPTLNYNTDLPYITYGEFKDYESPYVISDSLFRNNNGSLYHASAYKVTLAAGDSLIADFGGNFDSYLLLYKTNNQGGYSKVESADDTYLTNITFRERICYQASEDGNYFVVPTTCHNESEGDWLLRICKTIADANTIPTDIEVKLVTNPTSIDFNAGATHDDVLMALRNIKLYLAASADTICEVDNNLRLWTIDLTNNKATYTYLDQLLGYTFAPGANVADVTLNMIGSSVENNAADVILLYPNPAHDVVYLQLQGMQADYVYIYDLSGRLLLSQSLHALSTESINISHLAAGIYQVVVGQKTLKLIVR